MKQAAVAILFIISGLIANTYIGNLLANFVYKDPAMWSQTIFCYGPDFAGYNMTENASFNATQQGSNIGGLSLDCGPVGYNQSASASDQFSTDVSTRVDNSTGLQWNQTLMLMPEAPSPPETLDALLHNLTQFIYVNDRTFANISLQFPSPAGWMGSLTCEPFAYDWAFSLEISLAFKLNDSQIEPAEVLRCDSFDPTDAKSLQNVTGTYDGFFFEEALEALYSEDRQPSTLRRITELNGGPLNRHYLAFYPELDTGINCPLSTKPPPIGGDLGLSISRAPIVVDRGFSKAYPGYLMLLPNNSSNITGHTIEIRVFNLTAVPAGLTLNFATATPPITSESLPGVARIPALESISLGLTLTAAGKDLRNQYLFTIRVTDMTAGSWSVSGPIELYICTGGYIVPLAPPQLLFALFLVSILYCFKRIRRSPRTRIR